jgi:predicted transcriptional regulator
MTSHLSIRVPTDLAERLERLARATAQSKSTLAAEALEEYLALQEWQIEAIQADIDGADRGEVQSMDEVKRA